MQRYIMFSTEWMTQLNQMRSDISRIGPTIMSDQKVPGIVPLVSRVQHFHRQSNDLGMHETRMTRLYRLRQTIRTD